MFAFTGKKGKYGVHTLGSKGAHTLCISHISEKKQQKSKLSKNTHKRKF